MADLEGEVSALRSDLARLQGLVTEVATKRIGDNLVLQTIAAAIVPPTGSTASITAALNRTAATFNTHARDTPTMGEAADYLRGWCQDLDRFDAGTSGAKSVNGRDIEHLRDALYEHVAKLAAQRIFLVGLAAHIGQQDGKVDEMRREIERTAREVRRGAGDADRKATALISDDLFRLSEEIGART